MEGAVDETDRACVHRAALVATVMVKPKVEEDPKVVKWS